MVGVLFFPKRHPGVRPRSAMLHYPCPMSRIAFLLLLGLAVNPSSAQRLLKGTFTDELPQDRKVALLVSRGADHVPFDSTVIDPEGRFQFPIDRAGDGFYQLAVNDTDRVDLILSRGEDLVELHFTGLPLQYGIRVVSSNENRMLWDHKAISREAQAVLAATRLQRQMLSPTQVAEARALDSLEESAGVMREADLDRVLATAPDSYFAKVIGASRSIERELANGPMAIARVYDLSDPSLLRTSTYPKAVLLYLQALNANSEAMFVTAADTLMRLAEKDPECRTYMLELLVGIFSTYGPDMALQHVVDQYVVGHEAELPAGLLETTRELRAVAVGAIGPDVELAGPGSPPFMLGASAAQARYTALFFYSSTCDHCHDEMPGLVALYREFHPRGLNIIGIALDSDTAEFRRSILEHRLPWGCTSEFNGWGNSAAKAYAVKATPALILLDPDRRIVAKPMDHEELGMLLQALFR